MSQPSPPPQPARSLRILVVEDHADTAIMMQRILRNDGHTVDIANLLKTATELCEKNRYDLLLTDLELPDGLSYDLLSPGHPAHGLPAIAISGHGMPNHLDRAKAAGFLEHLLKPFSISQLREAIARVTSP